LGEGPNERAGLELCLLEIVEERGARALELLGPDRVRLHALDRGEQRFARGGEIRIPGERRAEVDEARIVEPALGAPDDARQALLHERAVQPPARRLAEDARQDVDGGV